MKSFFAFSFLFASMIFSQVPDQDAGQLLGRWRSVETSKGGIGAMYDFAADGTVNFSPGAIVPGQYHAEGDRLFIDSTDGVPFLVFWGSDDHLRLTANGNSEELTRLGPMKDIHNRLIGEWTGTRNMDGQSVLVHWIFNRDSTMLLTIRFTTQSGRYSVQNGRVVITFNGKMGIEGPIAVTDGVLSIDHGAGRVTRLARY